MSAVRSKVLIVEDEAMLVMSIEMLIEAHGGFDVVGTAAGATRALEIAATQRPDVALVDIQLAHGESGFDVAAELRRQGVTCLFMTGNPPDDPHPDLAIGVLAKPFGETTLFLALEVAAAAAQGRFEPPATLPRGLELY